MPGQTSVGPPAWIVTIISVGVPAIITGAAGIAGAWAERRWHHKDDEKQRADIAREASEERRRASDAACLRVLRPALENLRHEFEMIAPGVRGGVGSLNVFTPESAFYKAAEEFRHTALGVWLFDEALRTKLRDLLDTLREFDRQTKLLQITRDGGPLGSGGPKPSVEAVTTYSAQQKELLSRFLEAYTDFVKTIAEAIGFKGILND